uniref:F-box associated domain-containing protein n=1 Tax=Triticum urartu TaxID=4572 RepID=A0A8R7VBI3_TRIUA
MIPRYMSSQWETTIAGTSDCRRHHRLRYNRRCSTSSMDIIHQSTTMATSIGSPGCPRVEVVAFDTATESSWLMHNVTNSHNLDKLFDLEGKLALSSHDCHLTYMDVWVMEDYAAEIWGLKYRIDVSSIQASPPLNLASLNKENKRKKKMGTYVAPTMRFLSGLVMVNELELMARFSDKHLLRCNIDRKWLGMENIEGQYHMELTPHRFKQSILSIP